MKMPRAIFTVKDFLTFRYYRKRALYLEYLAKNLISCFSSSVKYEWFNNDINKPVLTLQLQRDDAPSSSVRIRFLPCIDQSVFELHKLHPHRNNIKGDVLQKPLARPADWRKKVDERLSVTHNENEELVTPNYSSGISEDAMLLLNEKILVDCMQRYPAFSKAACLLKVWARKHNLILPEFGMTGHFFTMLAIHILYSKGLSDVVASTLQVFKLLIEGVGMIDFSVGASLREQSLSTGSKVQETLQHLKDPPSISVFKSTFDAVLLDFTGWTNLASRMPQSAVTMLQRCAKCTFQLLKSESLPSETKFEKIFLVKPFFGMHFDHYFQVSIKVDPAMKEGTKLVGGNAPLWTDQERLVEYIAKLALGKRIVLAHCQARKLCPQVLKKSAKGKKLGVKEPKLIQDEINLFVSSNSELAHSLVDIGPLNTEKELCRNFRNFWGAKAQLRQFKDTSIAEAVIWEDSSLKSYPHLLLQKSLEFALRKNLKSFQVELSSRENALDFLIDNKNILEEKSNAIRAFDKLARMRRIMDTLPLKIESVQVASSLYRGTEPLTLRKHKLCGARKAQENHLYKSFVHVIECYAGLEGSGRWPKNVESQQKTLAAMTLHVANSLEKSFGIKCIGTEGYADILYDGYAFRLRLHALSGGSSNLTNEHISQSMKHHTVISGIATKHSSYCNVVQIAKRWFASHLMSPHMKQEVIELLVAEAYCNPSCLPVPASHWSGFLRFLDNLSSFPWGERPMYVAAMSGDISSIDHQSNLLQVETSFQKETERGKVLVTTPYQVDSQYWAETSSASEMCRHAVNAAKSSILFLDREMPNSFGNLNRKILSVFTPSLKGYDVVLDLHPESVPLLKYFVCISEVSNHVEGKASGPICDLVHLQSIRTSPDTDMKSKLILGENLALVAATKIQSLLSKYAFVGYDEFGGTSVYLSWNPSFFVPSFELPDRDVDFMLPVKTGEEETAYVPNILAVMAEVCANLRGFLSNVRFRN